MAKRAQAAVVPVLCILTACSIAESQEAIHLQLCPEIGSKRTLRLTRRLFTSCRTPSGQEDMEHVKSVDVEFEPLSRTDTEGATIRVRIQRIFEESTRYAGGEKNVLIDWDSADDGNLNEWSMGEFVAFLGETFTVKLSPQGRIVEMDTDDFYAAIARNRVKHENESALNFRLDPSVAERLGVPAKTPKPGGEQRIKEADDRHGSRRKRLQAYEKDAATFSWYGTPTLRRLLTNTAAPLPAKPVKPGDRWQAPVVIHNEAPMKLAGTHILSSVNDDVCTIHVEAQRTLQDKPVADIPGEVVMGQKLEGPYRATLTVDRTTGCLLARNVEMNLTGSVLMPGHPGADADGAVAVTVKATVTAEPLE